MTDVRVLKLGTRRSLLAWAQSSRFARDVEARHPGVRVELVGIETRGDQIQDIPLSKIEGKEFFVAELDDALRSGQVDLTVHSLKDLSLQRPDDFILAAIPRRASVQDVIIFHPRALARRRAGESIRIGTSSPRRLELLPRFLTEAFPRVEGAIGEISLDWREIRGNVNTRLGRIHEPDTSDRQLDGVVLAWAGLERLLADTQAAPVIANLLADSLKMIVPITVAPPAPGQGALAVECRRDDAETRAILDTLHEPAVQRAVEREREILEEWGGGCHQALGVSVLAVEDQDWRLICGVRAGQWVERQDWSFPAKPAGLSAKRRWISTTTAQSRRPMPTQFPRDATHFWITHRAALPADWAPLLAQKAVWVPGWKTWRALAQQGVWVQGCADGLGWHAVRDWLENPFVHAGTPTRLAWLTHQASQSFERADMPNHIPGKRIATYVVSETPNLESELQESLAKADFIYWKSVQEWERFSRFAAASAHHSCGPGGTAQRLRAEYGDRVSVFPNPEVWTQWLSTIEESD